MTDTPLSRLRDRLARSVLAIDGRYVIPVAFRFHGDEEQSEYVVEDLADPEVCTIMHRGTWDSCRAWIAAAQADAALTLIATDEDARAVVIAGITDDDAGGVWIVTKNDWADLAAAGLGALAAREEGK